MTSFNLGTVCDSPQHPHHTLTCHRKNSAQKTIHKMLDNDPRHLRPESRDEMNQRINSLSASLIRRQEKEDAGSLPEAKGKNARDMPEVLNLALTESRIHF